MNESITKATIAVIDFLKNVKIHQTKSIFFAKLPYCALTISGLANRDGDHGAVGNQECFESTGGDASSFFREGEGDVFWLTDKPSTEQRCLQANTVAS